MKKGLLLLLILAVALTLTACGCKHENTEVQGAVEATCTQEGYTGNTVCVDCDEVVKEGEAIPMLAHTETVEGALEATCTLDGYTGDTVCSVCGAVLSEGEIVPATGHGETELVNDREPTCEREGYTGDELCTLCNTYVSVGEPIEKLPHTPGEPQNAVEATCTQEGYTGNIYCAVCGEWLENGEDIPRVPHTLENVTGAREASCTREGYTGTGTCSVCGEVVEGETSPRLEHTMADGVCSVCGWEEPGLYVDGELEMTWDELAAGGYIELSDDGATLKGVHEGLYGRLVVSEAVTAYGNVAFNGSQLEEIWSPCTVPETNGAFGGARELKTVRFFGDLQELNYKCFSGCEKLESVVIPDSVRTIPDQCFAGCAALTSVTLPANLEIIDTDAFSGTASLAHLDFPETLTEIGGGAFSGSGLVEAVLPASVEEIGMNAFRNCPSLVRLDLSQTAVTSMYDPCGDLPALTELLLPHGLESGDGVLPYVAQVEALTIPEGVTEFSIGGNASFYPNEALKSVVWPVSLKDASGFDAAVALETVYYRGSELEWSLIDFGSLAERFAGVNVVFDYEGE